MPERRRLDETVRDGEPPPAAIVAPLTGAVRALLDRLPAAYPAPAAGEPVAVVPGTLASWSDDVDEPDDFDGFDGLGDVEAS